MRRRRELRGHVEPKELKPSLVELLAQAQDNVGWLEILALEE